jgi:hypothetical protein
LGSDEAGTASKLYRRHRFLAETRQDIQQMTENVFDIQQGVAIGLFVKCLNEKKEKPKVHHADLWGVREEYEKTDSGRRLVGGKYYWLWENSVATTSWQTLEPEKPFYLFIPQDIDLREEYERGWNITDTNLRSV